MMTRGRDGYLFFKYPLSSVIDSHRGKVSEKLSKISSTEIDSMTEEQLTQKYIDEFFINPLKINSAEIELETQEKDIDVSYQTDLYWSTPGPHYKRGTVFRYYVPYEGDDVLFDCQPSTYSLTPPYAPREHNQLKFEYEVFDGQTADTDTDAMLERDLEKVTTMIDCVNNEIQPFNNQLENMVVDSVRLRKEKLAEIGSIQGKSKYKTRMQPNSKLVFPTTSLRSKQRIELPIHKSSQRPEPYINDADYERIISLIKHTGMSIERNARTYSGMDEEELRDVLLTQLNGHYEGKAAGEAFNAAGKTDILVRDDDKNVFIGECKIWSGGTAFSDAIDQLLSYAAWRDTKTALIIFSRNKDTTKVVEQIEGLVSAHVNYKRTIRTADESDYRCVLKHRADENKELYLCVIVLDVPTV